MELFGTTLLLLIIASLQNMTEAIIEARKVLHIPEKIIGGMIDIVQSHKNKLTPVYQQGQVQAYQGYPQQYASWYTTPTNTYSQNQFQTQGQYNNYGNYPAIPAQTYPIQQGYGSSQIQNQYQNYPQNQHNFEGHNQQFLQSGYTQQSQFQEQNQQSGQFGVNQNQQIGQYGVNQNQIQGQTQLGQFVTNQGQQNQGYFHGQLNGQNTQSGHLVNGSQIGSYGQFSGHNAHYQSQSSGENGGLQVANNKTPGAGPTCVCQAWTKPETEGIGGTGKSEDMTEIPA